MINETILNGEQVNRIVSRLRLPVLRTIRHGPAIVAEDLDRNDLDHGFRKANVAFGDLIAAVDSFLGVTRMNRVAPFLLVLLNTLHEAVVNVLVRVARCGNMENMAAIIPAITVLPCSVIVLQMT